MTHKAAWRLRSRWGDQRGAGSAHALAEVSVHVCHQPDYAMATPGIPLKNVVRPHIHFGPYGKVIWFV